MTTQPTDPPGRPLPDQTIPVSKQVPAAAALLALAEMFGGLPAPYVTLHNQDPAHLSLQLDAPAEFETWRVALLIPSGDVEMKSRDDRAWLAGDGLFQGVPVHLTGHGVKLTTAASQASA